MYDALTLAIVTHQNVDKIMQHIRKTRRTPTRMRKRNQLNQFYKDPPNLYPKNYKDWSHFNNGPQVQKK